MSNKVVNFGCRLNIYESEIIKQHLDKSGLQDVIVVNTCTVTQEAEKQCKQQIRKLKKLNKKTKIIATGCAVQSNPQVFDNMPEVYRTIGNHEKLLLDSYINLKTKQPISDINDEKDIPYNIVKFFNTKTRALVQIQNGCNHWCSYCIIPSVRGRSRSVPMGVIKDQIESLMENGHKEIVFTGVDITDYGRGLPGSPTLAQMIKRILKSVPKLQRLRLSSIDVAEIDDEMFELMAHEPRIMPHFHLSIQSGDNIILRRMRRRHKREQVIDFCHKLRNLRPLVAFGADIIVGFPSETEIMFQNSVKLIQEADLQYIHVFPYSEREGTDAARMTQINPLLRKKRAKFLKDITEENLNKFFDKSIGQEHQVLIEKNKEGYSNNFIPVFFDEDVVEGTIVNVKLIKRNNNKILAKVC